MVIDVSELGTSYSKSYFFVWYKDERSKSIPWNASSKFVKEALEEMSSISGSVCVSRSLSSFNSKRYRWAVRFSNRDDDFSNVVYIETANVYLDHEASNVSITQLITNKPLQDWVTDDGEQTMCTERHAVFVNGSGSDTLLFHYEVLPGDIVPKLNFTDLDPVIKIDPTSKIVNAINNGSLSDIDAELNFKNPLVSFRKDISIDTSIPFIENVTFVGNMSLAQKYHAGDSLYFCVRFSKNVVVRYAFCL